MAQLDGHRPFKTSTEDIKKMPVNVTLEQLSGDYAVCLLGATTPVPDWAAGDGFVNVSRGDDELSIVCRADRVPEDVECEAGWTAFKLTGKFAFDETGIVLSVIRPLSSNGLGVFVVSTFHRDYLLVKTAELSNAVQGLSEAGHFVTLQ
ncbi:MAG: ACT domain-containing protein [Hyphomicrobiales bacterium]|uniref:ACT domain-containing protein n=1 Tax=Nisaea sp. TaxID=2024842 RepID=UPI0032696B69